MANSAIQIYGQSGFSGYSGGTGSSGGSGFSGYSGAGSSGFSGYSGSGSSGFSGYSGPIGTSGFSGYSGSGFSGYSGNGTSGFSGYSGPSGFSGYSGPTGASGFSGYSGAGTSGFSGYSGPTGSSGFSGYSGRSGFSGYSGPAGGGGSSGFSGYSGGGSSSDTYFVTFTKAAASANPSNVYLLIGDVTSSATKGIVMNQNCTVEGMSWQADISGIGGSTVVLDVHVQKNGTTISTLQSADFVPLGATNDYAPTPNNTSGSLSFASGDVLSVCMNMVGAMSPAVTITNIIVSIEIKV